MGYGKLWTRRHESFEIIYGKFLERIKDIPCAIFVKTEKENEK